MKSLYGFFSSLLYFPGTLILILKTLSIEF